MGKSVEYFPTDGFGLTKEDLIICDMCGCRVYDETESGWQRIDDMYYCPRCSEKINNNQIKK